MAVVLSVGNDSCFYINSIPVQRGQVLPYFETDVNGAATGRIAFRDKADINAPVVNYALYSDYTDASTGNPFASLADFITWCNANAFAGLVTGSGSGSPISFMKTLFVKAVPVGDDDVAPGATIVHPFLDSGALQIAKVAGVDWVIGDFIHTTGVGLGELELTNPAREFLDGDIVVLFKNP